MKGEGAGAKLGWLSPGEVLMQLIQTPSLKLKLCQREFLIILRLIGVYPNSETATVTLCVELL